MSPRSMTVVLAVVACAFLLAACNSHPTSPRPETADSDLQAVSAEKRGGNGGGDQTESGNFYVSVSGIHSGEGSGQSAVGSDLILGAGEVALTIMPQAMIDCGFTAGVSHANSRFKLTQPGGKRAPRQALLEYYFNAAGDRRRLAVSGTFRDTETPNKWMQALGENWVDSTSWTLGDSEGKGLKKPCTSGTQSTTIYIRTDD